MVNVAGRSKGCSTCRKRRVKCDETRPVCLRCQRCDLACEGPKDVAFVEASIVKSRRTQKKKPDVWTRHAVEDSESLARHLAPVNNLRLRSNEHEVYICYTRTYLHPNGPIDVELQDLRLSSISDLSPIPTNSTANTSPFPLAILTFSTIYFGTQHHQPRILTKGYTMHGLALTHLTHALSDAACYTRDDILLSVVTLAMLECLVPSGPRNWVKHMLGLEKLLGLRDPEMILNCEDKVADLYKGIRDMILFASLRARRPSILARREWKDVLGRKCSGQEQGLYDILADGTVLIAASDKLLANRDYATTRQRDELKLKAMTLLAHLSAWKAQWDSDAKNAYSEESSDPSTQLPHPISNNTRQTSQPLPLPTILRFTNDASARLLMLYNTTLIHILQILASLTLSSPSIHTNLNHTNPTFPQNILPEPQHQQNAIWTCITTGEYTTATRLASLEVARCIPDYLDRKRARSDPQFSSPAVQWAVSMARAVLGGDESVEGRWMMDLLNGMGSEVVAKGVWDT